MRVTIEAQTEALQNFATTLDLTVHIRYFEDKRKQPKYFLCLNSTSISPTLDYNGLNHFMLGFLKCKELKF